MASKRRPAVSRRLREYRRKRDFSRSAEPRGSETLVSGALRFVIQKHAASHLHFDFRLELDGVMKSWAVPKGPSVDPAIKRLAMQVEDHPIEYNTFEGTIPKGEYGGGTVMIWDRGTYTSDPPSADPEPALRAGYARGDLKFRLEGERLRGSWVLVRTKRGDPDKPQWLLIKHRDDQARPGSDVVAEYDTSVATGRTMEEIAAGDDPVWHSNRTPRDEATAGTAAARERVTFDAGPARAAKRNGKATPAAKRPARKHTRDSEPARTAASIEPMLASIGTEVPEGPGWTFEPKYDGIRLIAYVTPTAVRLITRNQKDKTAQFPEIAEALQRVGKQSRRELVFDGEAVALVNGKPARFQELQHRMHLQDADAIAAAAAETPAAFFIFDLLLDGPEVLLSRPWTERRARLELRLRNRTSTSVHLSDSRPGDGDEMLAKARADGWEGIIAKRTDAPYEPGQRSRNWLKLKVQFEQEFVVGGYTEPRNSREYIGALLLGYFDHDRFIYVGHTGGGFDRAGLQAMYRRLKPLERKTSPFEETPRTNEPAHWVRPNVVVEVKFNEWTADGKLRQPIFLGVRDDKDPHAVTLEPSSLQQPESGQLRSRPRGAAARAKPLARRRRPPARTSDVARQLESIEHEGGTGTLQLPRGATLDVSSLDKIYFPGEQITKGALMRYYAQVAPAILAAIADRPLVLKRTPDGIEGEVFFQQRPSEHTPAGVRVENVTTADGSEQERVIGGDLPTLLYTVQLGCISVDPWLSRVGSTSDADYAILDLDPGPRAPFSRVVRVAQLVKEQLDARSLIAAIKTSGSRGLHIAIPLPPHTSYETSLLLAQLIATRVAHASPREATVERAVKARPPATVYVDYLQNVEGKSVASAYCVRAKPGATVSTPLEWRELGDRLDPREFTLQTVPSRLARLGDLWGSTLKRRNPVTAIRSVADE